MWSIRLTNLKLTRYLWKWTVLIIHLFFKCEIHCIKLSIVFRFKDFQSSGKFDNPYLIIPWITNDNSEHLCALVSGTCFRVHGTLLYLHEHCPYITYYCFFFQSFIIIYKNVSCPQRFTTFIWSIVFLIIQFKLCL